jgi:putative endopeptidase
MFTKKALDDEFFDFYKRKLAGQQEQRPVNIRAINIVNRYVGELFGQLYVDRFFPENNKNMLLQMINRIITVMEHSITHNDWLTDITKEKALLKLSKFSVKIGYPDKWKDYSTLDIKENDDLLTINKKVYQWKLQKELFNKINSVVDRTEWLMSPQTVNAYCFYSNNEIVFPAAIIQPPFNSPAISDIQFDIQEEVSNLDNKDLPVNIAASYGGIGAVIAHEITHGYDDKGRLYDGDGILVNWWSDEDDKKFKNKTDIMAKQTEAYTYVSPIDNSTHKINAQLTMGKNLADLGDISLSFKALNIHLTELKVSDNDRKLCHKIFFKSFATIWKHNIKPETQIERLTTDPHSPADFRCNLIKNIDAYYELYDVQPDDGMYIPPEQRVCMW